MKNRFFPSLSTLLRTGLLAVLLAACTPAQPAAPPTPPVATEPAAIVVPSATLAAPPLASATKPLATVEATALPIATSRGPNLQATDPATVNLASGGLQFVEFFRFT